MTTYKELYQKNIERYRQYNRNSYWNNKDYRNKKVKEYQLKSKIDVVNHYSNGTNQCKCCGVSGLVFLTVDHINGDGAVKRKTKEHRTGTMFYLWLRKNKYPEGFQILCHNCNQAKRQLKICPHQELLPVKE